MWIIEEGGGVRILCLIQPKASKTEISGLHGEPPLLKIRVAAPPVDGEANKELIAFLSRKLKIPKNRIRITKGLSGRAKEVAISGSKADEVSMRLINEAQLTLF